MLECTLSVYSVLHFSNVLPNFKQVPSSAVLNKSGGACICNISSRYCIYIDSDIANVVVRVYVDSPALVDIIFGAKRKAFIRYH